MERSSNRFRPPIGSKMYDVVTRIDIFSIVVHLMLITAGAFIALFLSNLQMHRAEKQKEIIMLEQLSQSLKMDIQNLKQFADYHQGIINKTVQIRRYLMNRHSWNDSLSQLFAQVSGTSMLFPHLGAFESLKSTGIDLIHNPEINTELFTLYEEDFQSLKRLQEEYDDMLLHSWLPYVCERVVISNTPAGSAPVNFSLLSKDVRFLNFITIFNLENNALLYSLRGNILQATILQKEIELELERIQDGNQDDIAPRNVRFTLNGYSDAKVVTIPGSFNGWLITADTMKKEISGWYIDLQLRPGWYMYKFRIDTMWMEDPSNNQKIQNEYGTYNSMLKVE